MRSAPVEGCLACEADPVGAAGIGPKRRKTLAWVESARPRSAFQIARSAESVEEVITTSCRIETTNHLRSRLRLAREATLHGSDRLGLASEATLHGSDRLGLASEATLHGADRLGLASEATLHGPDRQLLTAYCLLLTFPVPSSNTPTCTANAARPHTNSGNA